MDSRACSMDLEKFLFDAPLWRGQGRAVLGSGYAPPCFEDRVQRHPLHVVYTIVFLPLELSI